MAALMPDDVSCETQKQQNFELEQAQKKNLA